MVPACIEVIVVAVVAGFTGIHTAVATALLLAGSITTIAILSVTVVTGFETVLISPQVDPGETIAAAGRFAGIRASIPVLGITIVTGFFISPQHTVAAGSDGTVVEALVFLVVVAIVTAFAGLDDAIAATRGLTVITGIGGVLVPVVAALAGTENPVATASLHAAR